MSLAILIASMLGAGVGIPIGRASKRKPTESAVAGLRAVLMEDIVKHAKPLCKTCRGKGYVIPPGKEPQLCSCAAVRFARRHQGQLVEHGNDLYWKEAAKA